MDLYTDEYFMKEALKEAQKAFDEDEVPVGAIIVSQNQIIARGYNQSVRLNDFTAHAEMIAFTAASDYMNGKYLNQCKLYVTVEPCTMCTGASYWTQIGEIIYGTEDKNRGLHSKGSNYFHPKTKITTGVLKEQSAELMQRFFKKKRKN
ncbi:MAG: nucleoside deaminase [Flavobacteriales bacterium]